MLLPKTSTVEIVSRRFRIELSSFEIYAGNVRGIKGERRAWSAHYHAANINN